MITVAIIKLENAGYTVKYLGELRFDVPGLGENLDRDQLCDLSDQHGQLFLCPMPVIDIGCMS